MDHIERATLRALLESSAEACGSACWRPAVDVYRLPDGWLCKFDLAGVALEDVHVRASCNRLRVSGVRRDLVLGEDLDPWTMEIAYHVFERTVELPDEIERCRVRSTMQDGMLLVRITGEEAQ